MGGFVGVGGGFGYGTVRIRYRIDLKKILNCQNFFFRAFGDRGQFSDCLKAKVNPPGKIIGCHTVLTAQRGFNCPFVHRCYFSTARIKCRDSQGMCRTEKSKMISVCSVDGKVRHGGEGRQTRGSFILYACIAIRKGVADCGDLADQGSGQGSAIVFADFFVAAADSPDDLVGGDEDGRDPEHADERDLPSLCGFDGLGQAGKDGVGPEQDRDRRKEAKQACGDQAADDGDRQLPDHAPEGHAAANRVRYLFDPRHHGASMAGGRMGCKGVRVQRVAA